MRYLHASVMGSQLSPPFFFNVAIHAIVRIITMPWLIALYDYNNYIGPWQEHIVTTWYIGSLSDI